MNFRVYFDSLAFLFITDEDFQATATAAGVDWFKLPEKFECVKIVRRYLEKRAVAPHQAALNAVRDDLRFLEAGELNFKLVPTDSIALAYEHQAVLKAFSFRALGERLIADPTRGESLLNAFESPLVEAAKSSDLFSLIEYELSVHREKVAKNEAVVIIPGFEKLSEMIGGFNPGHLIAVTAATGFGKTNLGLNLAIRAASSGKRVAYGNFEMTDAIIAKRSVVIGTGISYADYQSGNISDWTIEELKKYIGDRVQVTHGRALSLPAIEAWARMLKKRDGLDFLFIDYDQKIVLNTDRYTPEWKAIQNVFIRLDDLTKELQFCCIIFAQVNREGEISASHRAIFSTDTVISFERHPTHGPVLWAKKNRHGIKGEAVVVDYSEANSRIREIERIRIEDVKPETDSKQNKKRVEIKGIQNVIERYL